MKTETRLAEQIKNEIEGLDFMDIYINEENRKSRFVQVLRALIKIVADNPIWCKVIGHKIVSSDYANPNSGAMGYYCERCGYGEHSQLY